MAPRHARAGASANPAVAEALYEEARNLMKQGKLDQACPKFKQSYDLDAGGGTLLNLAECYEKQGKFASAWSSFKEAQVQAQRDGRHERVDYAKKHIAAVEPKLSKITIAVSSDASTPGLRVLLDGAELGSAAWNVGVPIDPGPHELAASAPSKVTYDKQFEIAASSPSTTPYGTYAKDGYCNEQAGFGDLADVKSFANCQGHYEGLYDMVGNIEEWIDACDADAANTDHCAVIGGSEFSQADGGCEIYDLERRDAQYPGVGFRCCSK